jgi:hypothetical protein
MSSATNTSGVRLRDLSIFIRSKNAGPFMLTIDIFFDGPKDYQRVIDSRVLTAQSIAGIYRVDSTTVRIIHVAQANAIKVSLPRPIVAGDIGDCDVAGGQQFAPLMDLVVPS